MPFSVLTNPSALAVLRHWGRIESALAITTARLASGLRINSARDDAAGLGISQRLMAQIRGMDVATRNANDAISMAQTGEAAAASLGEALQRMRELAVRGESAVGTSERADLQAEFVLWQAQVTSLIANTAYNGTSLLNNANSTTFQVGANGGQTVPVQNTNLSALSGAGGSVTTLSLTSQGNATSAATALDTAIDTVSSAQAQWGAVQNRFASVVTGLATTTDVYTQAHGRIVDADFAAETMQRARLLILQESSAALLAQANTVPQQVARLLLQ